MEDWSREEKEENKEFRISELSLAIVNVLDSLCADVRIHVFPRIILTGGGVSIPNIKEKLEDAVQKVLSRNPRYAKLRSLEWKGITAVSNDSFWRGFVIARLSKICGERMTREEWSGGKRWKDPIVQWRVCWNKVRVQPSKSSEASKFLKFSKISKVSKILKF